MALPGRPDMFGAAKLELVRRAAGLPAIAAWTDTEPLAAHATEPEPADLMFDDEVVAGRLRDRRVGADSYRDRRCAKQYTPGLQPGRSHLSVTSRDLDYDATRHQASDKREVILKKGESWNS